MNEKSIILLLWLITSPVFAQSQTVQNSLEQKLSVAKDTSKVKILISLSQKYLQSDLKKSLVYSEKALQLSRALHYTKGIASSLASLSYGYFLSNDHQRSLELSKELLALYKKNGNEQGQASAFHNRGNIYKFLGGYTPALNNYFQSLRIYDQLADKKKMAMVMKDIGTVYEAQKSDSMARYYYLQSLQLLQQLPEKDFSKMTMTATVIGNFYGDRNETEKALTYLNKAFSYAKQIPSKYKGHAIAMTLANLGSLYENKRDYSQALAYNQQAFHIAETTNNKILLGLNYENRARIYQNMDSLKLSNKYYLKTEAIRLDMELLQSASMVQNAIASNNLKLKNYTLAERYAQKALETANRGGYPREAGNALKTLIAIHKQVGNYQQAFNYLQEYQTVRDTLFSNEKTEQILKLSALYETEKKEKQIALLQNKTEKEKVFRLILIGGFAILLIIGFLIYNQERIRRRKNEALFASRQALNAEQLKNTQMHEEQLQNEVKAKNKELTTYALNFIQKNQLLETLKTKITHMRKEANGDMSQKLNSLQHIIRHSFNLDEDWGEFRLYFEQVHDQFFKELNTHYPDLSNKELRLCALLKLNLSTKEMATILGISPASVKMARYRLRKKLNLNSENDLTAFMIRLEKNISEKNE
jgi:tetratricopeptide (TPR) repeat protein